MSLPIHVSAYSGHNPTSASILKDVTGDFATLPEVGVIQQERVVTRKC